MKSLKNLPNILSVIRIFLIPFFAAAYLGYEDEGYYFLPASILIVSGLTDAFDGFIARKFHFETKFGKIIDPLADKLTQFVVCLCIGLKNPVFICLAAVYFLKEVCMLIGGLLLTRRKIEIVSSKWWGKVGTALFYAVMCVVVFFPNLSVNIKLYLCIGMAAIITCVFVLYIPEFIKLLKSKNAIE